MGGPWGKQIKLPYLDNKETSVNEHLRDVISTHFDPTDGSNYWLKKEKELNLDARKDITDFEDLKAHLGLKGDWLHEFEDAMRYLPILDMVPKSQQKNVLFVGETGGTTGVAKKAAFSKECRDMIIRFCNYAIELHEIPLYGDGGLLYIGPTGPHTFGFFAMGFAENWNRLFFTIDLDTRIIKKYIADKMEECSKKYMNHIIEQTLPLLKSQEIDILMTTSKILEILPQHINLADLGIKGIIHAGTSLDPDTYRVFKEELYLDEGGGSIPLMGLYGNGHSGAHVEISSSENDGYNIDYFPPQPHIISEIVDFNSGEVVNYGERGQVVWFRLTHDFLIPGLPERDEATRIRPAQPFDWDGVQNVDILRSEKESVIEGVY